MTTTTILDQRYELKRRLFSEGNQAAYEARDQVRADEVVVFLIPPAKKLNAETNKAVRADIERAFRVSSPTLLPLLDLREAGEHRFLVMPKPEGANAWTRITQKKKAGDRLGADEALRAADDLIAAAEAAHARDTTLGFSPKQVWIGDDGSARVQFYWIDRVNLTGGGPERFQTAGAEGGYFQAPELAEGSKGATPSADQFFICAVLYGLLTGQVPGGKLEPIRKSRSDVPAPMAKAIERGLAQDPGGRHPDLQTFRKAIHRRTASLGFVVPVLLLLVALWAGRAAFLGGADVKTWAFEDSLTERRETKFTESRLVAKVVPAPSDDDVRRYAGRYDGDKGHVLWLRTDGSFFLDAPRPARGLWWPKPESADALVLMPAPNGKDRPSAIDATVEDGRLVVAAADAVRRMTKVGWPSETGAFAPLIRLDVPLAGTVATSRKIQVVGRVAVTGVEVRVGGVAVPVVRTRFDTVVDAPDRGDFEIVVSAKAKDGFEQTVRRTVHVDDGIPQITATATLEEIDGVWTLRVEGRCADDGRVAALSVNEEPVKFGDDGSFDYVREDAAALSHPFVEIVAVDDAGRAARQLLWPTAVPVTGDQLAPLFKAAEAALADGKSDEVLDLLREIRAKGGLIEKLKPDAVASIIRSGNKPRISLDDYPEPPRYFENDGSMEISLSGKVDWFAPGDVFEVAGKKIDVDDKSGRFDARVQLPKRGLNRVAVRVMRDGEVAAERAPEVWLASEDGPFQEWTGVPVTEEQRRASAKHGLQIAVTNSAGLRFVLIPDGKFWRKTAKGQRFEVHVTKPYYIQVGEVSRRQFNRYIARSLPTSYTSASGKELPLGDADNPAMDVTRAECIEFARRLSADQGGVYRLPTEAEWELAARAGDALGSTYWGSDTTLIARWANFADQAILAVLPGWPPDRLSPGNDGSAGTWRVQDGRANQFGVKNMLGNASEWVSDFYAAYDPFGVRDPAGPRSGKHGVNRGGSFRSHPSGHGFGKRFGFVAVESRPYVGFRLVLESGVR